METLLLHLDHSHEAEELCHLEGLVAVVDEFVDLAFSVARLDEPKIVFVSSVLPVLPDFEADPPVDSSQISPR